ncbi:hypothetical protein DKT77_08900 [Meridianimarinicoccus roseus]|uniref:Bacteriophage phiJL001 Gp84 C-terminal domain-containing protein n=1 Tax=Meridianimarinicoccus roseus TaxID=2072018 RepID=A0A2V2LHN1_9RHOB|nr:DUF2163 domain-containing protein [Meridianimarinicoccus roseus]PWR03044.1 hypothetical protein DKT77_08900 [Meridianimarinicoccus roseus]
MAVQAALAAHLAAGTTTLCRCWAVVRTDGAVFGFTDHDRDVSFEGIMFRADTGLTGQAVQQTTGLAVDNGEALGALSDASVTEADLAAGRFDNARVRAWLVNWAAPAQRHLQFDGTIGEVQSGGGAFRAELRGLTERLNQPQGRVFQRQCSALLGDRACRVSLDGPPFSLQASVSGIAGSQEVMLAGLASMAPRWFERGKFEVMTGSAAGLSAMIKSDEPVGAERRVRLWQELRAALAVGDLVRVQAGCDKRAETCRAKFGNFANFRGFPHIPGEDWLMAYPRKTGENGGGSMNR